MTVEEYISAFMAYEDDRRKKNPRLYKGYKVQAMFDGHDAVWAFVNKGGGFSSVVDRYDKKTGEITLEDTFVMPDDVPFETDRNKDSVHGVKKSCVLYNAKES